MEGTQTEHRIEPVCNNQQPEKYQTTKTRTENNTQTTIYYRILS
jgi:hypothetical protein